MYLDQKINVFCTDHDTEKEGKIIRIYANGLDVEVSGTIIKLYEYNLDSEKQPGRAKDSITRWVQDRLSTKLPAPALPFYVSDLRHKERDTDRLFNPLNVRLAENSKNNNICTPICTSKTN